MTAKIYKVLFEGKIKPEQEEESVKINLASLFKADEVRIKRLFSGKPYAIRKGLSEKDARKYEKAIMQAGGLCRIVNMDGETELEPANWLQVKSKGRNESLFADINKRINTRSSIADPFRLIRRIGRCQYISLCWVVLLIEATAFLLPDYLPMLMGGAVTIQQTVSITLGIHALAILVAVYAMVSRLHDMNRTGELWLFILIPIVNLLFMFWLALAKGTRGDNLYGMEPVMPGQLVRFSGLYLPVGLILGAAAGVWFYQQELLILIQQLPATLSTQLPENLQGYISLPPL